VVEDEPLTGAKMKPGDILIGLESSGIHSNGYTLARKVLDSKKWGKEMLEPTRIYVKPVMEMLGKCDLHGIAHITGGAFSKLTRIGSYAKVGFVLDSMPKMQGVMAELEKKLGSDYEMHRTFNCGIGMVIACPASEEGAIIGIAKKHGIAAQVIGKVTTGSDVVLKKGDARISLL
jgi:phosphoribosylformylglycinamidine cyclo-ligase